MTYCPEYSYWIYGQDGMVIPADRLAAAESNSAERFDVGEAIAQINQALFWGGDVVKAAEEVDPTLVVGLGAWIKFARQEFPFDSFNPDKGYGEWHEESGSRLWLFPDCNELVPRGWERVEAMLAVTPMSVDNMGEMEGAKEGRMRIMVLRRLEQGGQLGSWDVEVTGKGEVKLGVLQTGVSGEDMDRFFAGDIETIEQISQKLRYLGKLGGHCRRVGWIDGLK